jgi:hypothetical protein
MKSRLGWVSNSSDSEFSIDLEDLTFDQKKQLVDDNDRYDIENKVEKDRFQGRYGRALTDEEQIVHAKAIKEVFDARPKEHYEDIDFEEFMEELDETPRVFCPVCNLAHLSDKIVLQYIVNTQSISVEELKETIRDKFKTLDDVKKFLGE